jgi:hypothetical protein
MSEEMHEEVPRDLAKLWTWAKESVAQIEGQLQRISDALWGVNLDNGLNSRVSGLEKKTENLGTELRDAIAHGNYLYEVERKKPGECIGKELVEKLEARLAAEKTELTALIVETRKARYAMLTGLGVGLIAAASPIILELVK